jgi:DNA-binding transcriptional LysR family regulator
MDWDDLRYLLAVARHGSHSAAARALGVAQPTVGRRLAALQRVLGVRLLERAGGALRATAAGRAVLAEAEVVEERVLAAERCARAGASELAGEVKITASDWLVTRVLPAVVPEVAALAPALRVDLETRAGLASLVRNEADLALRPARFDAAGVWQRAVGHAAFAVYATPRYLARHGPPDLVDGCAGHELILMDDAAGPIADVVWLRRVAGRARVRARVNGREAMAQLALAGAGLACLPALVGDALPGLAPVRTLCAAPGRTLWLGVHRDRRDLRRVRSVADVVARVVAARLPRART